MEIIVEAGELQLVESGRAVPIRVQETDCVLLRKDRFDDFRHLLADDDEFNASEMAPMLAELAPEDWVEASEFD